MQLRVLHRFGHSVFVPGVHSDLVPQVRRRVLRVHPVEEVHLRQSVRHVQSGGLWTPGLPRRHSVSRVVGCGVPVPDPLHFGSVTDTTLPDSTPHSPVPMM